MKWFYKVLKQYANFNGRASREELWMFFLFNFLATFALAAIGYSIMMWNNHTSAIFLPYLYLMAVFIPNLAVVIRRLHDVNKSAWFLLVNLIPFIGGIWLFIVLISKGDPEENRYGTTISTAYDSRYQRKRSAAVALIISSVFWLVSQLLFLIFQSGWNESQLLSVLLPLGLVVSGVLLFSKRIFSLGVAWSLIVVSVVWIFRDALLIQSAFTQLFVYFNIPLFISQLIILVPVALCLCGIYIISNKEDRTIPVCLLFAGSSVWILTILLIIINFSGSLGEIADFFMLWNNAVGVMVAVSLMVFARTFLSNEKSSKEVEMIIPIIEQPEPPKYVPPVQPVVVPPEPPKFVPPVVEQPVQPVVVPSEPPKYVPPVVEQPVPPVVIPIVKQPEPPKVVPPVKPVYAQTKPVVNENRKKVVFVREDRDSNNLWVVYKALSKVDAMAFLSKITIDRPNYFVVVETPDGNFGRDKDGFYQE